MALALVVEVPPGGRTVGVRFDVVLLALSCRGGASGGGADLVAEGEGGGEDVGGEPAEIGMVEDPAGGIGDDAVPVPVPVSARAVSQSAGIVQ